MGLVADFGGYANTRTVSMTTYWTYLFGPRFNWRHSRLTPYAQFLFCGAYVWNDPTGLSTPQNAFRYCKFLLDLFLKAKRVSDPNALVGERKDDIFLLAEYFIERYANKAGKKIRRIERKTLEWLED
jgi:hypothetical protein